ncbi:Phage head morphogenesis domain containing protein [uncultured Caudovirales phage]|uniref:Phage head morphogenesis domain containing protein n=1 Tax=uncultured Caudovirales phage TaxID=2100421 RepID=A0A6J5RQP7_9CAUD|nr:Phage head morphogenesis domain containing protein [uncultured Caudovirales phage]CAB4198352.1 Phage head morphogenesis domain containing protein [uncultured Caudovirales phage]
MSERVRKAQKKAITFDFEQIHAAADSRVPEVRNIIISAIGIMYASITPADAALAWQRSPEAFRDKIDWSSVAARLGAPSGTFFKATDAATAFGEVFIDGGRVASASLTGNLNLTVPQAISYGQQRAGALITSLQSEQLPIIRDLLGRALNEGIEPARLGRLMRSTTGLNARQARSLQTYEQGLRERLLTGHTSVPLNGAGRPLADQRFSLNALNEKRIDTMVERYRERLVNYRAEMIARTETMRAANVGAFEEMRAAGAAGLFDIRTAQRVWVVTQDERTCDICGPMEGQTIGFEQQFVSVGDADLQGSSTEALSGDTPPIHPMCRCTSYLNISLDSMTNAFGSETAGFATQGLDGFAEREATGGLSFGPDLGGSSLGRTAGGTVDDFLEPTAQTVRENPVSALEQRIADLKERQAIEQKFIDDYKALPKEQKPADFSERLTFESEARFKLNQTNLELKNAEYDLQYPPEGTRLQRVRFDSAQAEQEFKPMLDAMDRLHPMDRLDGTHGPTRIDTKIGAGKGGKVSDGEGGHFSNRGRGPNVREDKITGEMRTQPRLKAERNAWRDSTIENENMFISGQDFATGKKVEAGLENTRLPNFAHEFGHRLDYYERELIQVDARGREFVKTVRAFVSDGGADLPTETLDAMSSLLQAAREAPSYVKTIEKMKELNLPSTYFNNSHEVWARTYAQWVSRELAVEVPELNVAFNAIQQQVRYFTWTDDEFAVLKPLLEDVLKSRGMWYDDAAQGAARVAGETEAAAARAATQATAEIEAAAARATAAAAEAEAAAAARATETLSAEALEAAETAARQAGYRSSTEAEIRAEYDRAAQFGLRGLDPRTAVEFTDEATALRLQEIIDEIAKIHGVRDDGLLRALPKENVTNVSIRPTNTFKQHGRFYNEGKSFGDTKPTIEVNAVRSKGVTFDSSENTFIHEFGHRVDYEYASSATGRYASEGGEMGLTTEMREFLKAATVDSPSFANSLSTYEEWNVGAATVRNFTQSREVWARAYNQYIIDRFESKGVCDVAVSQFKARLARDKVYQWDTAEFRRSIAPRIEAVLKRRGIMV